MLDHNDIIRNVAAVDAWFQPMTFHVTGFLLLPFLQPFKGLSYATARDHAIRYLTPFLFAVLVYSLAFHILVAPREPLQAIARELGTALFFANPTSLHTATGFIVLWFLPALLSLVLLMGVMKSATKSSRIAIIVVATAVHLTVGGFAPWFKQAVPQGLLIALYILPLGLILRAGIPWFTDRSHAKKIAVGSIAILILCWSFEHHYGIEVATLDLPTFRTPLTVSATDASDLCFFLAAFICAPLLGRLPAVKLLGRHSLVIYLVHPLLYKPILAALLRVCTLQTLGQPYGALFYWSGAALSVILVASASLALAVALDFFQPARRLLLPRDLDDLLHRDSRLP